MVRAGTMPEAFWEHAPLHTAAEVLARPSPVPARPGLYGWFFREIPTGIDAAGTFERDGLRLLYVGISPKAPPIGGPASTQNLYKRIRYHYTGNAEGSTLRLTLGCLLERRLGIELRRVGSGTRMTFSDGEARLREWMETNAVVAVLEHQQPWLPEPEIIGRLDLPLNIEHNAHNTQRQFVRDTRAACKARARSLPVLPR
jgi:GIY-YIG catalytic domain-containing protein